MGSGKTVARFSSTLFLLLAISTVTDGYRRKFTTITATLTSTLTSTTTKSTNTVCASVSTQPSVPITACRRRRQYWIDVPLYVALDDDVDDQLSQFFLHPAAPLQVEPTVEPWGWFKNDHDSDSMENHPPDSLIPSQSIEPSWFMSDLNELIEPQIFGRLAGHFRFRRRRRKTVVVTSTKVTTSTKTETTYTSTNTFFISGCTPSSLPYNYCP